MVTFVDTLPAVVPVAFDVPFSLFTAQNQSVNLSSQPGSPGTLPSGAAIADVFIQKVTPFDANSVQFGHGTVASQRPTVATEIEVAAGVAGVSRPAGWMAADGMAVQVQSGARSVYARLGAGTVPTAGLMRIVFMLYFPTPRATL